MNKNNFLPMMQEEIDKERSIIVLIRNRHDVETLIDLYTAKKLVKSGDVEIIDETPAKPKADEVKPKTPAKPKADENTDAEK